MMGMYGIFFKERVFLSWVSKVQNQLMEDATVEYFNSIKYISSHDGKITIASPSGCYVFTEKIDQSRICDSIVDVFVVFDGGYIGLSGVYVFQDELYDWDICINCWEVANTQQYKKINLRLIEILERIKNDETNMSPSPTISPRHDI